MALRKNLSRLIGVWRRWSISFFIILAALGFFASLYIHFSSYVSSQSPDINDLWIMQVILFIPAIAGLLYCEKYFKDKDGGSFARSLKLYAPKFLNGLTLIVFVYAMVNFALFMFLINGSPNKGQNRYYLDYKGKYIRDLTKDEYDYYVAWHCRGFSGHWMFFYCLSLEMLMACRNKKKEIVTTFAMSHPDDD